MSSSLLQVRIDDELKAQASAVFEELGIDLPTAVRMFLKRSVLVNGIPICICLYYKYMIFVSKSQWWLCRKGKGTGGPAPQMIGLIFFAKYFQRTF